MCIRDRFDAVDDGLILFTENNITVLTHNLHNQLFSAQIPHLIQMFQFKLNNPFQPGLADTHNPCAPDMLAQQHAEIRGSHRAGLILIRKINQRQACAG